MDEPTAKRPDDQAPRVIAHGCPAGTDVQVATKLEGHGLVLENFTIWLN